MPTLITAAMVDAAKARNRHTLPISQDTLITPLAKERARDLGIALGDPAVDPGNVTPDQLRRTVIAVILRLFPGDFSPALVKQIMELVTARLPALPAAAPRRIGVGCG